MAAVPSPVAVPLNTGEALLLSFFGETDRELDRWQVAADPEAGAAARPGWECSFLACARGLGERPVLRIRRAMRVPCAGVDRLVWWFAAPPGAVVEVRVETDRGLRCASNAGFVPGQHEVTVALDGATVITALEAVLRVSAGAVAEVMTRWIMLVDDAGLARHLAVQRMAPDWSQHLIPEMVEPAFEPALGCVIDRAGLERIRAAITTDSPFHHVAALWRSGPAPEELINEFAGPIEHRRYSRDRDPAVSLLDRARWCGELALAGMVLRDAALCRLAARAALCLAACRWWAPGVMEYLPTSAYETRCFWQNMACEQVATTLDLCGAWFTPYGAEFLRRRLAEHGLGNITFNVWRYDYIHHCNQLAAFSRGRILTLLVLEKAWPRVRPYTDLALAELHASLAEILLPGGGFVEGPQYYLYTLRSVLAPLLQAARQRGLDPAAALPEALRQAGRFAAVYASSDAAQTWLPVSDDQGHIGRGDLEVEAQLAALLPDSPWPDFYHKSLRQSHSAPATSPAQWSAVAAIPAAGRELPALAALPEIGCAASHRRFAGHPVTLFVMGNRAGAEHHHEDKGEFILEFAGETVAMDPGCTQYNDPITSELKYAQRHNLLVPTHAGPERPRPRNPLPSDILPVVAGDAQRFTAVTELAAGWEGWYRRWRRSIVAADPAHLEITDQWELERGSGVDFLWNTPLAVAIDDGRVILTGRRIQAVLTPDPGSTITVEELPLPHYHDRIQRRIAIHREGMAGSLRVMVELSLRP